ncbi:hypothetical protein MCERE19_02236 [Spirosomataceae bacterium]|jgi:hypothetical protein
MENSILKSYQAEIYTICPNTGQTGWYIKMIRTLAENKEQARLNFKTCPIFDCIIEWYQVGGTPEDLDLDLINKDNLYYFL